VIKKNDINSLLLLVYPSNKTDGKVDMYLFLLYFREDVLLDEPFYYVHNINIHTSI